MTIAIAIVGGLAILLLSWLILIFRHAETMHDPSGDAGIGLFFIFFAIYGVTWLFCFALYILALIKAPTLSIVLIGIPVVALPLLERARQTITRLIIEWFFTVTLFVLALVK